MDAKLVVVGGKAAADEYQLELPTIVGRSRNASLPVGHPLVSRQHCELFEQDGHLMVRDLGSLNGTFVDDNRLTEEPVVLRPGGLLMIGTVTFQAVYGEVTEPSALDDDQPDFSFVETGSVSKIAQIKQTIHAETLEDLHDPDADEAVQPPARPSNMHTETLPVDDSDTSGSHRDDSFDLNWLDDDADSPEVSSPEDTAEVASPVSRPALPNKAAQAAKPATAARPQPPARPQTVSRLLKMKPSRSMHPRPMTTRPTFCPPTTTLHTPPVPMQPMKKTSTISSIA